MKCAPCVLVLALAACSGREPAAPAPGAAEWHGQRGAVTMTVRASPDAVTVGERLKLSVVVRAPPGVAVTMPEVKEELGSFKVRSARTPPDVPQESMRLWESEWEIDTFASGEAEIPALTVRFGDPAAELTSEPLPIAVHTVLTEGQQPQEHRDIKAPVMLRGRGNPARALLLVVPALLAAALGTALLAMQRRRTVAVAMLPAHERALQELAQLQAEGLPQRGAMHEFYFRLADIVRRYLERRFGILAPERTTEEFLREARTNAALGEEHKAMLGRFLRSADMVKFALAQPGPQEAAEALDAARDFVAQTQTRPAVEAAA